MSDRAPDGMPTHVLRNMVAHAEEQVKDWGRSISEHRDGLTRALGAHQRWKAEHETLAKQLEVREKEEATE